MNVTHEILIQQFDDGSHNIKYSGLDPTTFREFVAYLAEFKYFEHFMGVLPKRFADLLEVPEQEIQDMMREMELEGDGCGDPNCVECGGDAPCMLPDEVLGEHHVEDEKRRS